MSDALDVRPSAERQPLHPTITQAQINHLVEGFYAAAWDDDRLGPIFSGAVTDRPAHLEKMKLFWSSVLLKTGAYKGRPVPAHVKLRDVGDTDFVRWLGLFRSTCNEAFDPAAAPLVIEAAERIARSLHTAMAINADAVARRPPDVDGGSLR